MEKLSVNQVLHVANLAKIHIDESDMEKYQEELTKLLEIVQKIDDIVINTEEILIAPWSGDASLREDVSGEMLSREEVLKNVPRKSGSYIEVPGVMKND